ncbi:MAG: phosphatase PAP2 family protein [Ignavibacteriae bacterium]|nr:phosphatase PAP2 family protein [Ignavibacteriota bacterium]
MLTSVRAALLLAACFVSPIDLVAQDESSFDVTLFRYINNQQTEKDGLFEFIDQSSFSVFIAVPVGLLVYGALADDRSVFDTGVLVGTSQTLTLGATALGKFFIDRPRPFQELQNVKLKHQSSATGSSFPSGHASGSFAIATALAWRSGPAVYIPVALWAAAVGYGRIYVGVHYPTDVIGGIVCGVLISSLVHAYRGDIINTKDRLLNTQPTNVSAVNTPILSMRIPLSTY